MTVPLPDMNTVFNMAINHERQQLSRTNQVMSQAMCIHGEVRKAGMSMSANLNQNNDIAQVNVVHFKQQQQHFGGRRFNNQKKMFHCTFYNNNGHTMKRYYKKHGYPPHSKFKGMEILEIKGAAIIPCPVLGVLLL